MRTIVLHPKRLVANQVTGYGSGYVTVTDLRVTGLRYVRPPYRGRNYVTNRTSNMLHRPHVAVLANKSLRQKRGTDIVKVGFALHAYAGFFGLYVPVL